MMGGWTKQGLIYCPSGKNGWDQHSFMTPTPYQYDKDTIRIYGGFRDNEGVSRIGFIDVDANNPKDIKQISQKPVLDIGEDGCFDDNGIILGDVIKVQNKVYMYYVGFQLVKKAKFLAFTGLAISEDNGDTFQRVSRTPILDRCNHSTTIQAIHSVKHQDGIFKIWFSRSIGSGWYKINDLVYPAYDIWYMESDDGINFKDTPKLCVSNNDNEYRIGRPRVFIENETYKMFYTRDTKQKEYKAGYAFSTNGFDWIRADEEFPLKKSNTGWDSKMLCYPTLFNFNEKNYIFYNGNNMGQTGVGFAQIEL